MREKSDASWEAEQEKARLRLKQIEDQQKAVQAMKSAVNSAFAPFLSKVYSATESIALLAESLVRNSIDRSMEPQETMIVANRITRLMNFAYYRKPWYRRLFIRYNKLYTKIAYRAVIRLTPPSSQA